MSSALTQMTCTVTKIHVGNEQCYCSIKFVRSHKSRLSWTNLWLMAHGPHTTSLLMQYEPSHHNWKRCFAAQKSAKSNLLLLLRFIELQVKLHSVKARNRSIWSFLTQVCTANLKDCALQWCSQKSVKFQYQYQYQYISSVSAVNRISYPYIMNQISNIISSVNHQWISIAISIRKSYSVQYI